MKKTLLVFFALMLSSCAPHLQSSLDVYMKSKNLETPTTARFPHCQGYGCPVVMNVELNKKDWADITKTYGKPAKNAEAERIKISRTIGAFERIVGPLTGTKDDKAGTFIQTGKGQLDCVDESTNTTIYMMMLEQKGLLKFHTIEQPQVRYPIVSGRGWMHQTAVIREKDTGTEYAVDSWFEDNGKAAWIVPMENWHNGWHPELAPAHMRSESK